MADVALRTAPLGVGAPEVARLSALLDDGERAHAARFRFARDRRRFVVRRGRLREWLGERTGEAPEKLTFTTGEHGKPVLPGGPHFSLSHSGDTMMAAFADVEIGCDIERIDADTDWRPLAERLFAPAERAALATLPDAPGRVAFFNCWARKEAFVKAIGRGLSWPLDAFAVSVDEHAKLTSGGDGWSMRAAVIEPGFAGAVVARDDRAPLRLMKSYH